MFGRGAGTHAIFCGLVPCLLFPISIHFGNLACVTRTKYILRHHLRGLIYILSLRSLSMYLALLLPHPFSGGIKI